MIAQNRRHAKRDGTWAMAALQWRNLEAGTVELQAPANVMAVAFLAAGALWATRAVAVDPRPWEWVGHLECCAGTRMSRT